MNMSKKTRKILPPPHTLKNYIIDLVKREDFIEDIARLRANFNIPRVGFPFDGEGIARLMPGIARDFEHSVAAIGDKYAIPGNAPSILMIYVLYNVILTEDEAYNRRVGTLCSIQDVGAKPNRSWGHGAHPIEHTLDSDFPIAIQISPYASLGEIRDFLAKEYSQHIKPLQERYRRPEIKLGKLKTRKSEVMERNDFIYSIRHLPFKEIYALTSAKFGYSPDEGAIGAIISKEKKRRGIS